MKSQAMLISQFHTSFANLRIGYDLLFLRGGCIVGCTHFGLLVAKYAGQKSGLHAVCNAKILCVKKQRRTSGEHAFVSGHRHACLPLSLAGDNHARWWQRCMLFVGSIQKKVVPSFHWFHYLASRFQFPLTFFNR